MPTSPRQSAIDVLQEARRYVTSNCVESRRLIAVAIVAMREVCHPRVDQLISNLYVASRFIQVEPDVCRGYVAGAVFEMQKIKDV